MQVFIFYHMMAEFPKIIQQAHGQDIVEPNLGLINYIWSFATYLTKDVFKFNETL